jgi:hypothetical protein
MMGNDTGTMVGFGPKQAWLAVSGANPSAVVGALDARDLGAVSWREGVDLAYLTVDRLILTPPLAGADGRPWLLVAGRWLLIDTTAEWPLLLSERLGTEVQFFASYRVGERHRWGRARDGVLLRAFEYVGETGEVTVWHGEPDSTELAVGLPQALEPGTDILVSEHDVMKLAGAWSVDPTTLDGKPAPGRLHALAMAPSSR